MDIHKHLVDSLAQILIEIFRDGAYADKIISRELKAHKKWGSRDRRFFAEQVYDCVRWWRKYWFILGEEPSFEKKKLFRMWGIHRLLTGQVLPSWPELEGLRISEKRLEEVHKNPAVETSVPDWLFAKGQAELGDRWMPMIRALNEQAPVDLRVNTLKIQREQLRRELESESVATELIPESVDGLTLRERKNVFMTKAFHQGFFEVQDRASQMIAPFLQVAPGMRVVDACAGAGGKSLHISTFLKNKGKLISMDIHEWKLKELKERARRNGIDVIETRVIEGNKTLKRLEGSFDRVLLDVPCSGMGVLRRNPDTKWKLTEQSLQELQNTQALILADYSRLAKNGGVLVYATCSILPSENEAQVEKFLHDNKSWKLDKMLRIDPDQGLGDGFFAARLLKNPS